MTMNDKDSAFGADHGCGQPVKEQVNSPSHYGGKNNPYEVIKVIDAWGLDKNFNLANTIKYIARAEKKENNVQDLEKARWYLDYEINKLKGHVQPTPQIINDMMRDPKYWRDKDPDYIARINEMFKEIYGDDHEETFQKYMKRGTMV